MDWLSAGKGTDASLRPFLSMDYHSEKSEAQGPAAGQWAPPINPRLPAGARLSRTCSPRSLGPKRGLFLLTHPQSLTSFTKHHAMGESKEKRKRMNSVSQGHLWQCPNMQLCVHFEGQRSVPSTQMWCATNS